MKYSSVVVLLFSFTGDKKKKSVCYAEFDKKKHTHRKLTYHFWHWQIKLTPCIHIHLLFNHSKLFWSWHRESNFASSKVAKGFFTKPHKRAVITLWPSYIFCEIKQDFWIYKQKNYFLFDVNKNLISRGVVHALDIRVKFYNRNEWYNIWKKQFNTPSKKFFLLGYNKKWGCRLMKKAKHKNCSGEKVGKMTVAAGGQKVVELEFKFCCD